MKETTLMQKPQEGIPLIGIGATADSLKDLYRMLNAAELSGKAAFVVALQEVPEAVVLEALAFPGDGPQLRWVNEQAETLQAGRVYLLPPDREIEHLDHRIVAKRPENDRQSRFPIDRFFRTLARERGSEAIAIVLGGPGTDGVRGLRQIRHQLGVSIVQDPAECVAAEMPRYAYASGQVDLKLPLGGILPYLRAYLECRPSPAPPENAENKDADMIISAIAFLTVRSDLDINRFTEEYLLSRIHRRMRIHLHRDIYEYVRWLMNTPEEADRLVDDLLYRTTDFFSPAPLFDHLRNDIIPQLLEKTNSPDPLRIWVLSSGGSEEVLSLLMLIYEYQKKLPEQQLRVFVTDLRQEGVREARSFYYPLNIEAEVDQVFLNLFTKSDHAYHLHSLPNTHFIFSQHDPLADPPFSNIDLLFCREMAVALNHSSLKQLLDTYAFALKKDGFLVLNGLEPEDADHSFRPLHQDTGIYQNRSGQKNRLVKRSIKSTGFFQTRKDNDGRQTGDDPSRLHHRMLGAFQPASMLLSRQLDILHLTPAAGRYLRIAGGVPDRKLYKLLREELLAEAWSVLQQAQQYKGLQQTGPLELEVEDKTHSVVLKAWKDTDQRSGDIYFLLLIEEIQQIYVAEKTATDAPSYDRRQVAILRKNIQDLIKEQERLKKSLAIKNQELQSVHEELLSALENTKAGQEEISFLNEMLKSQDLEKSNQLGKLRETSDKLTNLIKSTRMATLFLDKYLRTLFFTPAAAELFGLTDADIGASLGNNPGQLVYSELKQDAMRVLDTLQSHEREVNDQQGRFYLARVLPYFSDEHLLTGVVLSLIDISDRREREKAEREIKVAEQTARIKDEFLSVMSHEIRTPLNAIIGISNLLNRGDEQQRRRNLEALQFSARNLLHLVNDVLDYSKMEAGKLELEEVSYRLNTILNSLRQAHEPQARDKGLHLELELDPALPEQLLGDPHRLTQVLNNLLGNALKFTEKGSVSLHVALQQQDEEEVSLRFAVKDSGIGIPPEKQKTIFEKFSQADASTVRRYGGTGLGLSISKSLLELMGSEIRLESRPGQGSVFYFELRQQVVAHAPAPPPEDEEQDLSFEDKHILIAEDVSVNRLVLQQYLDDWWDTTADESENGREALEKAAAGHYDLILMDVFMPEMDGKEAAQKIRQLNGHYRNVPILALTADTRIRTEYQQGHGPFDGVVSKPFEPAELMTAIRRLLRKGQTDGLSAPTEVAASEVAASDEAATEVAPSDVAPSEVAATDVADGTIPLVPDFAKAEAPFHNLPGRREKFYNMSLRSLREFQREVKNGFEQEDAEHLQKVMHKVKPLFGMLRLEAFYQYVHEQRGLLGSGEEEKKQEVLTYVDHALETILGGVEQRQQQLR